MAFTKAELAELAEYDKMVEKGIDLYPLDKKQEKNAKDARALGIKTVYNFNKRERKPNLAKRQIMAKLLTACAEMGGEGVTFRNEERELVFTLDGTTYKVTLSVPRSLD